MPRPKPRCRDCRRGVSTRREHGFAGAEAELAALADEAGVGFVDVALLGPIPTRGLAAPVLASGAAAQAFADLFAPLGMPVEVVSDEAGDAAALKLVRSVFMKGLAAAVVESMQAAEAMGRAAWLEREIEALIGQRSSSAHSRGAGSTRCGGSRRWKLPGASCSSSESSR